MDSNSPSEGKSFSISFDEKQLEQLGHIGKIAVERAAELTAIELLANVKKEAPTDHGRLAGSFEMEKRGPISYAVSTAVEYALVVQEGSQAHIIEPVNRRALYWEGADHPVYRVRHPGTKANPYIDRSISATEGRLEEFAMRAIREAESGEIV